MSLLLLLASNPHGVALSGTTGVTFGAAGSISNTVHLAGTTGVSTAVTGSLDVDRPFVTPAGRTSGRQGRLMVGLERGATPEPVAYVTHWETTFHVDVIDAVAMGDPHKIYVSDVGSGSGNWRGWYDDQTAQLYSAANDGVQRRFYLYPSLTDNDKYWFGSAFFDFHVEGGDGEIIAVNGAWASTELTAFDGTWAMVGSAHGVTAGA